MPEEIKDANPAAESSTAEAVESNEVVKPSEGTEPSQPVVEKETPFHTHPRFQELVKEKNELKEKLSQMETVLQEKFSPRPDPLSQASERLVKLGIKDEAAREILEAVRMLNKADTEQRVAALEQSSAKAEADSWIDGFRRSHEDFDSIESQMFETYKALPNITQQVIASDPMGLELLYSHVKMQNMKQELKKAEANGAKSAYENKTNKSGISPTTGVANPPGGFTRDSIAKMSDKEYAEKKAAIWEALRAGLIPE